MSRAADALQKRGDRPRRADLADEVDVADVDAELERGGRDEGLELAFLQPLLRIQPVFLREAAVVGRDVLRADPLREVERRPLRQAPVVHEDERRPVRLDQFREPLVISSQTSFAITASSGERGSSIARSSSRM